MWGQARLSSSPPTFSKDHPHACGDKSLCTAKSKKELGSSPRVWGQVSCFVGEELRLGIIPMRVGTRESSLRNGVTVRDHPHACGDKCYRWQACRYKSGSSPRVWGQAYLHQPLTYHAGIIPTRVGTSLDSMERAFERGDHPHACGDKFIVVWSTFSP